MEGTDRNTEGVQEVGPLLVQIKGLQKQTRMLRWGIVLLVLVIIVAWSMAVVNHFRRFDVEKFGAEMAKKAEATWPLIADELGTLVKNVLPKAEVALTKELEAAAPQIGEKFNTEARLLEENIKQSIQGTMKKFLTAESRAEAAAELRAAFPELATAEATDKLAASLQESFLLGAQQRLNSMLMQYYDTILKFDGAFKKLKSSDDAKNAPATMETVLSLWIELVYEKMGGDSAVELGGGKPAPAKKK
jgi:hypothetical protein